MVRSLAYVCCITNLFACLKGLLLLLPCKCRLPRRVPCLGTHAVKDLRNEKHEHLICLPFQSKGASSIQTSEEAPHAEL